MVPSGPHPSKLEAQVMRIITLNNSEYLLCVRHRESYTNAQNSSALKRLLESRRESTRGDSSSLRQNVRAYEDKGRHHTILWWTEEMEVYAGQSSETSGNMMAVDRKPYSLGPTGKPFQLWHHLGRLIGIAFSLLKFDTEDPDSKCIAWVLSFSQGWIPDFKWQETCELGKLG